MAAIDLTKMFADWNLSEFVSSLTANRAIKEDMEQKLRESMEKTTRRELVCQSRGPISRFVRSSDYSDIIAHNYMISQGLESTAKQCKKGEK